MIANASLEADLAALNWRGNGAEMARNDEKQGYFGVMGGTSERAQDGC
jgi:hypothetical protein